MSPIPRGWQFGPFAPGIGSAERAARLRAMRAIVTLHTGPRGTAACRALHLAEGDADALGLAAGNYPGGAFSADGRPWRGGAA